MLDACHSSRDVAGQFLKDLGNPQNITVITGCSAKQNSLEDPKLGHGRLTWALLEGLAKQHAYAKDKEFLLASQLGEYVNAKFRELKWDEEQTPQLFNHIDAKVQFDIARRSPVVTKPGRQVAAMAVKAAETAWRDTQFPDAVEFANTALSIDGANLEALSIRAQGNLSLGGCDELAEKDADAVLRAAPGHPLAGQVKAIVLGRRGNQDESFQLLRRVCKQMDKEPDRWPLLAKGGLAARRLAILGYQLDVDKHDLPAAIRAYSKAIELKGIPAEWVADVLYNCALCQTALNRPERAIEDYTRIAEMNDAPPEVRGLALLNRGYRPGEMKKRDEAILDDTAVLKPKGASLALRGTALVNHAFRYSEGRQWDEALADHTRVVDMRDAPADQLARALVNRAMAHADAKRTPDAIADLKRVITMDQAPPDLIAKARELLQSLPGAAGNPGGP